MHYDDPAFWRAGAISTIAVMSAVLIMLTIDSLAAISPGGSHVPPYTVINQHVDYKFVAERGIEVPVVGEAEPLFGEALDDGAATALIGQGNPFGVLSGSVPSRSLWAHSEAAEELVRKTLSIAD
jgi:nitric oxide reductase subunit C